MEQCPVGNRCKKCASRFTGHITKLPLAIMLRTGGAAAVLGFIFGYVENSLWGGIYMWLVLYAVGFGAGKLLHKIAQHKLGRKVVATILGGLLIGAMLSPAGNVLLGRNPNMSAAVDAAQSVTTSRDPEFIANAAIKARKHFSEFEAAFKSRTSDKRFSIKAPFEEGEDIEHVWLDVDGIDGEKITGRIASDQNLALENIKEGDVETVNVKDIDDFSYTDEHDVEHGSYSINRAAIKQVAAVIASYDNPYHTSSCWLNLLILAFGIISPVLAVKVRN